LFEELRAVVNFRIGHRFSFWVEPRKKVVAVVMAVIEFQGLDKRDDAGGAALGSAGIVEGDVGADLAEAGEGKGRPDDFGWAEQLC
jgi:hypothetical protein